MRAALCHLSLLALVLSGGCGQKAPPSTQAVHDFAQSISADYVTGTIAFTIPEHIPDGCDFSLQVGGRVRMGDGEMSVHPFEEEEQEGWEPGRTYTHTFGEDALLEAVLNGSLRQGGQTLAEVLVELENGGRSQAHTFWTADNKGNLVEDEEKTSILYD